MCGIIGIFGINNADKIAKTMLKSIEYRGKDSHGICNEDNAIYNDDIDKLVLTSSTNVLGHNLHSIIGNVDSKWFSKIKKLLLISEKVKFWRAKMWNLLEKPVTQRVASFVELAISLYSLSSNSQTKELSFAPKKLKLPTDLSNVLKMSNDDNMHQFLAAAFEYLSVISEGMVEVPINIIRAIKEVERIIKIEEQALSPKQQDLLRFYLLQIARLTGENG